MEPSVAGSSAAADTRPGELRGRDAVCLWVCTPCCTPRPRTWHPSTWRTAPASAPASLARGALGVRAELKNAEAASRGGCSGQCVQGGDLLRMWSAGARIPHLHAASSGAVRSAAVWNAPRGHREKPVACLTGVARARLLVPAAGSTPERNAGGDASSAANTRSNGKRRRGLQGVEAAVDYELSLSPINGCIATSGRAHDLWNGGPFAGLVRPTMGTTRHPEQEQQVVGLNSDSLPPSPEQDVCMRALTEVIRSRSLNARDKVRQLEVLCLQPEGSLLRRCLNGNGWNSKRNRREGYPSWPEAVHRLTIVLNALAIKEPVPTHFEEQVVNLSFSFPCKKKAFALSPRAQITGVRPVLLRARAVAAATRFDNFRCKLATKMRC